MVTISICIPEELAIAALQKRAFDPEVLRQMLDSLPRGSTGASPARNPHASSLPPPQGSSARTDDEKRLMALFRALESDGERSVLLEEIASKLLARHFPDKDVSDFMPSMDGLSPSGDLWDRGSSRNAVWMALDAVGDPRECLLGSSAFDEVEAVPRFLAGAERDIAQGVHWYRTPDADFLAEYLDQWRWTIVDALSAAARD